MHEPCCRYNEASYGKKRPRISEHFSENCSQITLLKRFRNDLVHIWEVLSAF